MKQGDINHQVVSVITLLPILTCSSVSKQKWLIEVSKSQHRGLKTCFLKHLKGSLHGTVECYSLILLASTFSR